MTSLLMKIFVCPLALIVADWLFPNIDYTALYQPIVIGLILAAIGTMMEYLLLKEGTLWTSTLADFAVTVLLVYFFSNLFPGAHVTFLGSVIIGIILGAIELFTHHWLIRSGKTKKSPA